MRSQKDGRITTRGLKIVLILSAFIAAFFIGRGTAALKEQVLPAFNVISNEKNWGLGYGENGSQPSGTESAEVMKKYNAYYVGDAKKKVLYQKR